MSPVQVPQPLQTQVLIVGAGVTGAGLARDLALRGVSAIILEKGDFNAGASGANHGLLHSGARYVESDPAAACECRRENTLLKRLAPQCIDDTGGLFVAVEGDDEHYIADFPLLCEQCVIETTPIPLSHAATMEPALSKKIIAAYRVNDGAIDPFKLTLNNLFHAQQLGVSLLRRTRLTGLQIRDRKIESVSVEDAHTDRIYRIEPQVVVNAAGAWANQVSAMAGIKIPMHYSKGSLLVTDTRLAKRVLNRLRKATDADILVPGGTVSILGTTSVRIESPDRIYPEIAEVDLLIDEGAAMVPALAKTRYIRAYCGVRPLASGEDNDDDDRSVSRGYVLADHTEDGVDNFITITGGKLTTFRLMAERTADQVCRHLGIDTPCRTAQEPLPDSRDGRWTEPGLAPREWIRADTPGDQLLCECEMVSQRVLDDLIAAISRQNGFPTLEAISRRSRIGKGPCQGTFCSQRVTADLYDRGLYRNRQGEENLRTFLSERWRGQHPLLWGAGLMQAELLEAMHCGLFGLELPPDTPRQFKR
jgi:glycerol-3-phosphate dehydrogenase